MKKILIVDDTETIRKMLHRQFEKRKYAVTAVESGMAALETLQKEKHDIVLLDQMMPEMDGMATFVKMKEEIAPCPPVIMLTAHGSMELAVAFMKEGGDDFVVKPVDFDILEIKITQAMNAAELRINNKQLKELNRLKAEFISNVSHELRTPLTSIKSMAEILLDDPEHSANEEAKRFLGIINKETDRLSQLVDSMLELKKVESRDYVWNNEEIHPKGLLMKAVARFAADAAGSGLAITCDCENEIPSVIADKERIMEVIGNLVSNAIKFSKKGGKVKIAATTGSENGGETDRNTLVVSVSDTGPGIPHEAEALIFEPFHQIDGSITREAGGTGLGLAICKDIVEHYGGNIWVESEVGKGSCFSFSLPAAAC